MLTKLKVYVGAEHPHHAQDPKPLAFGTGKKAGRDSKSPSKK
jgi:ribosomal protein L13